MDTQGNMELIQQVPREKKMKFVDADTNRQLGLMRN